ncbi:hypothetical protein [Persicirhabdus sediminis]|uniref:Uncharacterized protein n=1 Tax=Persicirhabdus sediminis TaxID=454144 RepID=A0A8J7SK06_9BACT|nr:hypothetical protein [Persicirhabdus sediminis]MBK1791699.1 hypothetical protein [Persicirhabdus sediminis]
MKIYIISAIVTISSFISLQAEDFNAVIHRSLLAMPVDFESHYEISNHPEVQGMLDRGEVDVAETRGSINRYGVLKKIGNTYSVDLYHSKLMEKPISSLCYDGINYYIKRYDRSSLIKTKDREKVESTYGFMLKQSPYFLMKRYQTEGRYDINKKSETRYHLISKDQNLADYYFDLSTEKVMIGNLGLFKVFDYKGYWDRANTKLNCSGSKRYVIHSVNILDGENKPLKINTKGMKKLYDIESKISVDLL